MARLGPRAWALLLLAGLVLAGCAQDRVQAGLCARVIAAVESRFGPVEILEADSGPEDTVTIRYRLPDRMAHAELEARCGFAGSGIDTGRLVLTGIETQTQGPLSAARLYMARLWLGLFTVPPESALPPPRPLLEGGPSWLLYLAQQVVNGLVPGILYALLAVGITLVWGLIDRIVLVFGQFAMIGAYGGVLLVTMSLTVGVYSLPVALMSALWLSMAVAAVYARATDRLVVRPTLARDTQSTLIASVGAAIAVQEFVRLVQGSRDRWLQPVYSGQHLVAGNGDFTLGVSTAQLVVMATFAVFVVGLALLLARTPFGRCYRACCDDLHMARLIGVPTHQIANGTFLVAGGLCAAAGFIVALYYGGVGAYMGVMLGFKGLTAAVLGGVGSVAGALAGGLLLGQFEGLWDAYLPIAWRNIAVFAVLTLVLVFRPQGLLGRTTPRFV
ncbi:MAG: branched-chain amino acid ABC transporter permease [Rhodospirillaceae bacterium]|nr:branched-chain amino acid ABC transporter permease [Rhodospirillaceae bacterium]